MFIQRRIRTGDDDIVEIPAAELEKLGFADGEIVAINIASFDERVEMSPGLRRAFEESWERNEAGYRYLADR